ncbi:NACHT and TPR domain-containing protein [Colletotrichum higginsianum]|uniref:NACHT and TPR domain-containing protein n=1 Tax=Colletotrichum higginsianum (strain IMI 349063) TaxID=759273 RepID=H1VEG9_COLHI|nr:NACHT and TPR domain-containing protein [Colletotrichum higginsianum IMI 349063]OBR16561.1 NACHT and TPR domain-containing protein [Colletotrichum higginsianum IMI 349063]GJC91208.1 NACHT and TPR domain-containing protein [Colletotrichum higginsianum]CCF38622.1 NACHT and TPR domain-containing protein [Colletotrichum higginsianum]
MENEKTQLLRSDSIQRQFAAILADAQKQYASSTGLDLKDYMNPPMRTTEDLLNVINRQNEQFQSFREKRQTLFQVLSTACKPLEVVGEALAGASEEIFPPGQTIFAAVMYLINAAKDVSACYDSIIDLFDQMQDFTVRLKFYVSQKLSAELYDKVVKILVTIFEIFVLATHEVRKGRLKSYFKRLLGSESKVPDAMKKLASLTEGEERLVIAETSAGVKRSLSNQERLLEMMSRVDVNVQTLRTETRVPQTREQALSSNRDKLKGILQPSVYPEDTYSALNRTRTQGTCDWIFDDPSLKDWLAGNVRFLWISGNPGTGKSYITSRLVSWGQDLLNKQETNNMMGYFFFRQNNPESRSMTQALRDIAYQISEQDVFYGKQLVSEVSTGDEIKTVSSAFRKLLVEPCVPDKWKRFIYVLMDGLDEADLREVKEFLSLLDDLNQQPGQGTRVQVALIGRTTLTDDVMDHLGNDSTGGQQLRTLHVTPDRNSSDIVSYIVEGVNSARILRGSTDDFKQSIIETMTKQVDGLFILAKFMLAELNRIRHPRRIVESLQSYPQEINGMLKKAVLGFSSSITQEEADDLNEILRWVSVAEMGLTLEQIESVLTLKMGDAPFQLEESLRGQFSCFFTLEREDGLSTADLADRHELHRRLTSIELDPIKRTSPDFLDMERDIEYFSNKRTTYVTFFHASVKEFFREDASTDLRAGAQHPSIGFKLADARLHVLQTCLKIFTDPTYFNLGEEGLSLQRYAAWYWPEHLDDIDIKSVPASEKADIGNRLYIMLTDPTILLTWTNLFEESLDIWTDHNIEVVSRWLKDADATSTLTVEQKAWATAASASPARLLEPMGRTFAKAWLVEGFGMYMPTLFCFGVVQSLPLMEKGAKWSDSEYHWQEVPLETRIQQAAEWASHPKTGHWYRRIGSTLLNLGEHTKALEYFEKALAEDSNIVESCGRMGLCQFLKGNYEKALKLHLMCEVVEQEHMAKGYYKTDHELKAAKWRLYKNQAQIAECYNRMKRVESSLAYCRKAMRNAYEAPEFEPEIAYMRVLTENNRVTEMMSLFEGLDGRYTERGNSRFVLFLLTQIPDQSIKNWFPQAAARTGKTSVLADRYVNGIESAHDAQDSWKEFYLRNALGNVYMAAQEYDNAISIQESICFVEYKARGSLAVRVEYIASFKQLARAYSLKALEADETLRSDAVEPWVKKLEKLMEQQRKYQNRDVPLHMAGFDFNEASIFLILLYRLRNREAESRRLLGGMVSDSLQLLEDDEPQNDEISIRHLQRTLVAAGDGVNAQALWQSTRTPPTPTNLSGHLAPERRSSSPRIGGLSPRRRGKQITLTRVFSESGQISCDHCLRRFQPPDTFAVCWYCVNLKFCLPCQSAIKSQNFTPGHTSACRPSHDWLLVPALTKDLQPGEILVGEKVQTLGEWKSALRQKWTQPKSATGLGIM